MAVVKVGRKRQYLNSVNCTALRLLRATCGIVGVAVQVK